MSEQLFTLPQVVVFDTNAALVSGAKANFYIAGTLTRQNTFTDSAQTTPHENPVVADGNGILAPIYLDATLNYKVDVTDSLDSSLEGYPVDNLTAALTATEVGTALWPTTTAESSAGVTPTNFEYEPGNVLRYGATGDGVTDDAAAIQIALDLLDGAGVGGEAFFPDGDYLIASALTIPAVSTGWKIRGESRQGVKITQDTVNTAIFKFADGLIHSFFIGDLRLTWTSAQTTSNTSSIVFDANDQTAGAGAYNGEFARITIENSYRVFSSTGATGIWGCNIHDIWYQTGTGSFVYLALSPAKGLPNNRFTNIYILGTTLAATEKVFYLKGTNFQLDNIEINNNNLAGGGALPLYAESSRGVIGLFTVENFIYTPSGITTGVFEFVNCHAIIDRLELFGSTNNEINPGGGNKTNMIAVNGTNNYIRIETLRCTATSDGTITLVHTNSDDGNNVVIGHLEDVSSFNLTDVSADTAANRTHIESVLRDRLSADNGDSAATLTHASENHQMFETQLTANRIVALPVHTSGSVFNGQTFTIIRNASTPGTFTLDIQLSTGGSVKTIPNDVNARVKVMYRRSTWVLVDYVVL